MNALTFCTINSTATNLTTSVTIAQSAKNRKMLPRSRFTRNKLRNRIHERELGFEVSAALAELKAQDQSSGVNGCYDIFYDCNPQYAYADEPWFYGRCDERDYYEYESDYEDYCSDYGLHDDYGNDHLGEFSHYGFHDDCDDNHLHSVDRGQHDERSSYYYDHAVAQLYFDEPDPAAPVYDRPRFSSDKFVRLPGRKVRFKKNKEQHGGNRRGRCDYKKDICKLVGYRFEYRRLHPDGSGNVHSISRSGAKEHHSDKTYRANQDRQARRDMLQAVIEQHDDTETSAQTTQSTSEKVRGRNHASKAHQFNCLYKANGGQLKQTATGGSQRSETDVAELTAHVRLVLLGRLS